MTAKPANDVEHFEVGENIKSVRLQCTPTGACAKANYTATASLGYSSLAQRVKSGEIELSSVKGEYIVGGGSSGGSGWGDEPVVNP
ncbi:MAG: hypothetical protein J6V97_01340 [Prevotella sp.]|nr:hypothetical protein [Prevotella sp.]